MIVTGIQELTKTRSRIEIDGEFAFVLYKGELRLYHVMQGKELQQRDYDKIMTEILPKRAAQRAMNLLLKRDYTTQQLSEKLRSGGYPPDIVSKALEYVASFHYTDDLRYASDYISCNYEKRSRTRIEQDLRRRGITEEVLEKAWRQWEQSGGEQDEKKMIRELLQKRGYYTREAVLKEKQREYGYLIRKGFGSEAVMAVLFDKNAE